jgi:hypothetical protein
MEVIAMVSESVLLGYARKSKAGGAIRLSIDRKAFMKAEKYTANDGRVFVPVIINVDKLNQIISGEREVTSVCQIQDDN